LLLIYIPILFLDKTVCLNATNTRCYNDSASIARKGSGIYRETFSCVAICILSQFKLAPIKGLYMYITVSHVVWIMGGYCFIVKTCWGSLICIMTQVVECYQSAYLPACGQEKQCRVKSYQCTSKLHLPAWTHSSVTIYIVQLYTQYYSEIVKYYMMIYIVIIHLHACTVPSWRCHFTCYTTDDFE